MINLPEGQAQVEREEQINFLIVIYCCPIKINERKKVVLISLSGDFKATLSLFQLVIILDSTISSFHLRFVASKIIP